MYAACCCCCCCDEAKLIFKLRAYAFIWQLNVYSSSIFACQCQGSAIPFHKEQGGWSVCFIYVLWPGHRQRFMGERTKTFIENTFSIFGEPKEPPSNCKFNKALYNTAKTYMRWWCLRAASAIIYNILIELDAGRRNMVDGGWKWAVAKKQNAF